MAELKTHKYVNTLPTILEADSIYYVRFGNGFDIYITNTTGTIVAHKLNRPNIPIIFTGRYYCYADFRWVTGMDDNYGNTYYQNNESGGVGVDPIIEWEHIGIPIPVNLRVKQITIKARTNNTQIIDGEFAIYKRTPNPITRWQTGFDSDAEDTVVELYRGMWWNNTDLDQPDFTGNTNDRHSRTFLMDTSNDANLFGEESELLIYFKPTGINTANRYFMFSQMIELEY